MSLRSVLESMTYKPTYDFEIVDVNGSEVLRITMHTHDSRPAEPAPLSIPVDFPVPEVDEKANGYRLGLHVPDARGVIYFGNATAWWRAWLQQKIHWCELHESDEWLRFDGELYRDPHKEAMIR